MTAWQPPPEPGDNPYPWHPEPPRPTSVLAIVSFVLGVVAIPADCLCFLGLPLGIGAIATGVIALRETGDDPGARRGRGLAIGGLATGAVSLVLVVVAILYVVFAGDPHYSLWFGG